MRIALDYSFTQGSCRVLISKFKEFPNNLWQRIIGGTIRRMVSILGKKHKYGHLLIVWGGGQSSIDSMGT